MSADLDDAAIEAIFGVVTNNLKTVPSKRIELSGERSVAVGRYMEGEQNSVLIEFFHPDNGLTNIAVSQEGAMALHRLLAATLFEENAPPIEPSILFIDLWRTPTAPTGEYCAPAEEMPEDGP